MHKNLTYIVLVSSTVSICREMRNLEILGMTFYWFFGVWLGSHGSPRTTCRWNDLKSQACILWIFSWKESFNLRHAAVEGTQSNIMGYMVGFISVSNAGASFVFAALYSFTCFHLTQCLPKPCREQWTILSALCEYLLHFISFSFFLKQQKWKGIQLPLNWLGWRKSGSKWMSSSIIEFF